MFYIVAVPVALLWFHSMYLLLEKYQGKEPFWLKCYLVVGAIYFIAIPSVAVFKVCEYFNLSNATSAWVMGITGTIMILILISKTPKN